MHENRTGLRKLKPVQKAASLISEGRVRLAAEKVIYEVKGDHDTYQVIAGADGIFCPCEARDPLCSHVLAVMQVRSRDRADLLGIAVDGAI